MEPRSRGPVLPAGCRIRSLQGHADHRGVFTEVFREEWNVGTSPCQWNLVQSGANVLRGVHVHLKHRDYLMVIAGQMSLGLADLRSDSPTAGIGTVLTLDPAEPQAVVIPPGVAHGFYFEVPSIHLYAVDHYWDHDDELGCQWDDPDLGLDWPVSDPTLSERDSELPSLAVLKSQLPWGRER